MFPKLTQAPRNKWGVEVVTFHKMWVGIYYTVPTKYIEGNKYHIPRDKMSKQYFSNPTITSRTPGGLSAGTTGAGIWAILTKSSVIIKKSPIGVEKKIHVTDRSIGDSESLKSEVVKGISTIVCKRKLWLY